MSARSRFPKELLWLNGPPGSGKGTIADHVLQARHITLVSVSNILKAPEVWQIR